MEAAPLHQPGSPTAPSMTEKDTSNSENGLNQIGCERGGELDLKKEIEQILELRRTVTPDTLSYAMAGEELDGVWLG